MWYSYNLNLLKKNEIKNFTKDFENVMINLLDDKLDIFENCLSEFKTEDFGILLKDLRIEYLKLTKEKKKKFRKIFINNYQIERILKKEIKIYTYLELGILCGEEIKRSTKELSIYMYEKLKGTAKFKDEYIGPLEYYKELKNKGVLKDICPFCGEKIFEDGSTDRRETYDHYIPKAKYPFIALHYYNLIPMCHGCNSGYKGTKNILDYMKIFDPFDDNLGKNELTIKKILILNGGKSTIQNLKITNDLKKSNEIYTWDKIFKVKQRSKKIISSSYDEILYELSLEVESGLSTEDELKGYLKRKIKLKQKFRYSKSNLFEESLYKYFYNSIDKYKKILKIS